jgi:hypothetical protein
MDLSDVSEIVEKPHRRVAKIAEGIFMHFSAVPLII